MPPSTSRPSNPCRNIAEAQTKAPKRYQRQPARTTIANAPAKRPNQHRGRSARSTQARAPTARLQSRMATGARYGAPATPWQPPGGAHCFKPRQPTRRPHPLPPSNPRDPQTRVISAGHPTRSRILPIGGRCGSTRRQQQARGRQKAIRRSGGAKCEAQRAQRAAQARAGQAQTHPTQQSSITARRFAHPSISSTAAGWVRASAQPGGRPRAPRPPKARARPAAHSWLLSRLQTHE